MTPEQLAALYDADNEWASDDDFFLAFVSQHPAQDVLDLGCGTGRLTLALAAAGHRVVGVDPDAGALAAARSKPGGDAVTWIEGTSKAIPPRIKFDVAVMTSHVAQAVSDEDQWVQTLADLARSLRPGGRLAFDSRNPEARTWQEWTPENTRGISALPDGTLVESWVESGALSGGLVSVTEHRVTSDGVEESETAELAFRTQDQLREALTAAGFVLDVVVGGWHGEPVGPDQPELIVTAHLAAH